MSALMGRFVRALRCWTILVAVAGLFFPGAVRAAKLYVVYASISGTQAIGWVAKEGRIFAREGLDVDLLFTGGGRAVTSLLGGDTPLITVGGPSVIAARLAGSDATIIAHVFDTILYSLIVQADVRSLADLKGKRVGASRFGSATDFALRYVLKRNGFDPLKDLVIVQIGGQAETLAALRAGSIQGGVIASPATAEAKRLGLRELVNMGTLGIEYPQTVIATNGRYLRTNRDTLLRFTRAYFEGAHRFINDRELALKVIAKYTKIQNRATLDATYDDHVPYVKKIPAPSAGSIKTVLEQLAVTDPKARNARPQDFYDGSIVAELQQEGFFSQVWS